MIMIVVLMIMIVVMMIMILVMMTSMSMMMMTWSMRLRGEDERSICVDKAGWRGGVHYHGGPEFQTDCLRIMMMKILMTTMMMMMTIVIIYLTILLQLFQAVKFSFFSAEEIQKSIAM